MRGFLVEFTKYCRCVNPGRPSLNGIVILWMSTGYIHDATVGLFSSRGFLDAIRLWL